MRSRLPVLAAGLLQRCVDGGRLQLGSESRPRLTHLCAGTLKPLPERRILLRQRDAIGLELAGALFQVLVDLRFVVKVKSNRAIGPGQTAQERIAFEYLLGRLASVERVHDRVQ